MTIMEVELPARFAFNNELHRREDGKGSEENE